MVVTGLRDSQSARSTNIPSKISVPGILSQSFLRREVNDGRGTSEGAEDIRTSYTLPRSPVNYRKGGRTLAAREASSRPRSSRTLLHPLQMKVHRVLEKTPPNRSVSGTKCEVAKVSNRTSRT